MNQMLGIIRQMKILVIGSSGLTGSRFMELSKFRNCLVAPSHQDLDITQPFTIKENIVINFSAYTDVSSAENQRGDKNGECWRTNVDGVRNILEACGRSKSRFIQISTDYVFAGLKSDPPHNENSLAEKNENKLTWYGFTKAEAERLVLSDLGSEATIVRLVYPVRAKFNRKLDYLRKLLSLFDQGKMYPLFTDQQISVSFIDEICLTLDRIIEKNITGTFHASSCDLTTPFDLGTYLLQKARGVSGVIKPALLSDLLKQAFNPVRYPQFGGLRVDQTEERLGLKFSNWKAIIDQLVEQGMEI